MTKSLAWVEDYSYFIEKRQVLPDLNGPPPIEIDHTENVHSSAHMQNPEPNNNQSSMIDLNECDHNRECEHWKSLSSNVRMKISRKKWLNSLSEKERKEKSRIHTKKWQSKLTREQKDKRNQNARVKRLLFKQKATAEEKVKRLERKKRENRASYQKSEFG